MTVGGVELDPQWHQLGWVTGTGKAGSTTGDGNADVMISSDGTHPTALGHQILGARMAAEIGRAARSIVAAGF